MDWTKIIWQLIIAVAPIIVSVTMKMLQDFILTRNTATQELIHRKIYEAVEMIQRLEPDPAKRKAWVMAEILKLFPKLDPDELSNLIEAVLSEFKLESGVKWDDLSKTVEGASGEAPFQYNLITGSSPWVPPFTSTP